MFFGEEAHIAFVNAVACFVLVIVEVGNGITDGHPGGGGGLEGEEDCDGGENREISNHKGGILQIRMASPPQDGNSVAR
jgi:hypothetical protein